MKKVPYPTNKREWSPSLVPGPVVLISTYDSNRVPNIAPKSWLQMVSFDPPILMFSGTRENTTERNILRTRCFGVNFVNTALASGVFESIQWFGRERIQKVGLTLTAASEIEAPLVSESRANLECRLHSTCEVGSGFVIFGEICAASIWDEILAAEDEKRYELLDQVFFLEDGVFARMGKVLKARK
ncbi:MAG: flavin reductase family protein [Armatimonadetes bacterium]|nr:flavin reductase family protein [Armatimonadota bacterium]